MYKLNKSQLFWFRLAAASIIIQETKKRREELAQINVPKITDESNDDSPVFNTKYAAEIWYILSRYPSIKEAALYALRDAETYRFETISSIVDKDDSRRFNDATKYNKLKKVDLLKHTYHVVWCASKMVDEAKGLMPPLLLLALLHDFGKSPKVAAMHSSALYRTHEKISANYAGHMLTRLDGFDKEFISVITSILANHHSSPTGAPLYSLLNAADQKARAFEAGEEN